MRCTIVAIGPRGDIQPMIALGRGLARAGVTVRCATHADFAASAAAHGLEVVEVQGRADRFFGGAAGVAVRERLADARAFRRFFDDYLSLFYQRLLDEVTEACRDADLVVCWPWTRFATTLAEALGVPVVIACPYPPMHLPTAAFANPFQRETPPGTPSPASNRRSWRLALPALQAGDAVLARRRRALGLSPISWRADLRRLRGLPHLLGYSAAVLPRPADWPPDVHVTGFWFLDDADRYGPPAALAGFLDAGPAPVAIGFSSQSARDAAANTRVVREAVARAGVRAVVLQGFGGVGAGDDDDQMVTLPSAPHDWLYPRVAAVVHHGGSGSTGAALRAGVPSMAVPFGYDQPLWGARLHALGVGPAPIPADELSVDRLAAALTALTTDQTMRARARQMAGVIRAEDGVTRAVDAVLALRG
ncbi:MAG: glycosyltransferase [Vicinamibacteria bacterium]